MKSKKLLACLLAVSMVFSLLLPTSLFSALAEEVVEEEEETTVDYMVQKYGSAEEKLATMTLFYETESYRLYGDSFSGEVALKDCKTGDVLFTNPYDVAFSTATKSQKEDLLSQLKVTYTKITTAEQTVMNSYTHAALLGQISVKAIRGGIRVEYTIGQTSKRKIVPRWIEKSRFEEMILSKFEGADEDREMRKALNKITSFYTEYSYAKATSQVQWANWQQDFPFLTGNTEASLYVLAGDAVDYDLTQIETYLRMYTDYSLDDMLRDHEETMFEDSVDESPPVFKISLEYYVEDGGLRVRLPANAIRYDSEVYFLDNITVLPYMGCGGGVSSFENYSAEGIYEINNSQDGYTLIPDGSGTLVRFESSSVNGNKISSTLFGIDNAFYKIDTKIQYDWRFPVFGVAQTTTNENTYYKFDTALTEVVKCDHPSLDFDYAVNCGEGRILLLKAVIDEASGTVSYEAVADLRSYEVKTAPSAPSTDSADGSEGVTEGDAATDEEGSSSVQPQTQIKNLVNPTAFYETADHLFLNDESEIVIFDKSFKYVGSLPKTFTNTLADVTDQIGSVKGIAASGGYYFVHDGLGKRILVFNAAFAFVASINETFDTETDKTATFRSVDGVKVDGNVFIVYDATAGKAYSFGISSRYWVETLKVEIAKPEEEGDAEGEAKAENQEEEADKPLLNTDFAWGVPEEFIGITKVEEQSDTKNSSAAFLAIITEGEALSKLWSTSAGKSHTYCTAYAQVFPSQTDTYPLSGMSVSGSASTETASTKRAYKGNFTFVYKMLNGDSANYVGMAAAYREHLISTGVLKKNESKNKDAVLYIETFGAMDISKRVFGVPVDVKTALTSFEQAQTMLEEFKKLGITNMVLRYKGWMNGGMVSTVPAELDVESEIGGEDGLTALYQYAKKNGISVYPDMNFSYVVSQGSFDGFSGDDAAQSIDGRTALLKTYDPAAQTYHNRGPVLISSNVIEGYFQNIVEDYKEMKLDSISVGTIGAILNSDHNEEAPLNREDSKEAVVRFLKEIKANGLGVMVEKGNSYTLQYADHILDMTLDSSNNTKTHESVPFIGMVLHGYVNFTGEAINLAGDYRYNLLKTIENGADIYFVLSYQNTAELKNSRFNNYYSVDYNTWMGRVTDGSDDEGDASKLNTVEAVYNHLNSALKLVKSATVVKHEFVDGQSKLVRVTYDNDVVFIINYTDSEVEVDGVKVAAYDFAVKS